MQRKQICDFLLLMTNEIQLFSVIFISPQTITKDHDTMKTILHLFLYINTRL